MIDTNTPQIQNIKYYKDTSLIFNLPVQGKTKVYKAIQEISRTAPMRLAVPNHEVPDGWLINISGVLGMKEANYKGYKPARVLSKDILEIPDVNATVYTTYQTGGVLEFIIPYNIKEHTALLEIWDNSSLIYTNNNLTVDNTTNSIKVHIDPKDLELPNTPIFKYRVSLVKGSTIIPIVLGTLYNKG